MREEELDSLFGEIGASESELHEEKSSKLRRKETDAQYEELAESAFSALERTHVAFEGLPSCLSDVKRNMRNVEARGELALKMKEEIMRFTKGSTKAV